jgi:hypothetical protein
MPDFASALFRANADVAEVLTDAAGSRTVWYALSDSQLIASTSQRMIVASLRTFEPNGAVIPWMLLSGGSGPRLSWDRRIECMPPDSTLRLDRMRWRLTVEEQAAAWYGSGPAPDDDQINRLQEALDRTFAGLRTDDDTVLPLSGGYDSRAILLLLLRHLRPGSSIRAITWGTRDALGDPTNDAYLARSLCRALNVDHRYLVLDETPVPFPTVFRRFVAMGEGRTDHIGAYIDGFAMWQGLHDDGIGAVLRGDMGFGYPPALTERDVRLQTGFPVPDDYRNLPPKSGLREARLKLPFPMGRMAGESCTEWNGRLGHAFRLPINLAALTQLKTSFVELLNPLLARPLLRLARSLPGHLYVGKHAFKKVVERLSPSIPFARTTAIPPPRDVYRTAEARAFLRQVLGDGGGRYLPQDTIDAVMPALAPSTRASHRPTVNLSALKKRAKGSLPKWVASIVRSAPSGRLDPLTLAFRAAIVTETCKLLTDDAKVLRHEP